jgi:hypothetical protein
MTRRRRERPHGERLRGPTPGRSSEKSPRKPFPKDPRATFRLSENLRTPVSEEEISILVQLSDAITSRLGPDAAPGERVAAAEAIWAEDPELQALHERLIELMRINPMSVARGLIELGRKEDEEEGE